MKRSFITAALIAAFALSVALPSQVLAWDLTGWEKADPARGQWGWFTGQSRKCEDKIPMPGHHTKAEWEKKFTTDKDKLPCGGAGISDRFVKHIFLFLQNHAKDSANPMVTRPEGC